MWTNRAVDVGDYYPYKLSRQFPPDNNKKQSIIALW